MQAACAARSPHDAQRRARPRCALVDRPRAARVERSSPAAGRAGHGGSPGRPAGAYRAAGSPIRGNAADSARGVGVQRVGEDLARPGPPRPRGRRTSPRSGRTGRPSTDRSWLIIIMPDAELARPAPVSRSSTWACTITSSAVVGSSATISRGPAGQRHRDHHPLLLAAGELVRVGAGPRRPAARPARAARRPGGCACVVGRGPGSCSRIGSAIWSPIRCTGLSECSAPWKTIEAPGPAHRPQVAPASSSARPRRRSSTSPVTVARRRAAAAGRCWPASTCRSRLARDADDLAARRRSGRRRARRARRRPSVAVGDRQVANPEQVSVTPLSALARQPRVEDSSSARPTRVNASTTRTTQTPGGRMYHQAPGRDRADAERVVEHRAPRDAGRVAEAEEAQRRLGQDRDRHGQRGVGEAPSASRWAARACVIWCQWPAPSTRARSR